MSRTLRCNIEDLARWHPWFFLEVSGTETRGELARRHRKKVAQALRNPLGWDAYVVVCAFSSEGHRIRLSFHHVQELADDETPG